MTDGPSLVLQRVGPAHPGVREGVRRYVAELAERFGEGFVYGPPHPRDAAAKSLLATYDGETVACGTLRALDADTAEVKRMWVDGERRGLGLGRRVLDGLEALAADLGHRRVVLDTHLSLTAAVALYDHAGYARIERYNDNPHAQLFFAKDLAAR